MKHKILGYIFIFAILAAVVSLLYYKEVVNNLPSPTQAPAYKDTTVKYLNDEYGFSLSLADSWKSYEILDLISFLTTGEDESRAWTAHMGDLIPKAATAIHTDFEKLFIRAEVINWKTLLEAGSWSESRSKGLLRTVGRDYIIQEGDVVEIKI